MPLNLIGLVATGSISSPLLHTSITVALQDCLWSGVVPEWMVKGRTVLIQKDSAKEAVASNYRPIACLPLMWNLLCGIFAEKIYYHLLNNNLLPKEQKGCRKKSGGTKDQLLIGQFSVRSEPRKGTLVCAGLITRRHMIWFLIVRFWKGWPWLNSIQFNGDCEKFAEGRHG